jgi:hypothetical protein
MKTTTKHDTAQRSLSCKARWRAEKNDRISDLKKLFTAHQRGEQDRHLDTLGVFSEYGLGFDYVAPGTFVDAPQGYWRYQLSWGGPSEEFRFYAGGCGEHQAYRISYAFLDWFDGHERALVGNDLALLQDIWGYFRDTGATVAEYRKACREVSL